MSREGELLVRVEGVSKKFCKDLRTSLKYGVRDLSAELLGLRRQVALRPKEFWAVRDVSFDLRRGECLGLIGHNGAGKTTLLRMINGLIKPDAGRIELHGSIGALIALGAGFNPVLTGRENVYTNAALLGVDRRQVDARFEEIVDFAELREFIDTPTQYYSSGMNVRLGFAVAALLLEPDILILDEVLAVGDLAFRTKCINLMRDKLARSAVIFVSHSMPTVSSFCTRALLMDHGRIASDPAEHLPVTIRRYMELAPLLASANDPDGRNRLALSHAGSPLHGILDARHGEALVLEGALTLEAAARVALVVKAEGALPLLRYDLLRRDTGSRVFPPGEWRLRIDLGAIDLNPARYTVDVLIVADADRKVLSRAMQQFSIDVHHEEHGWQHIRRSAPVDLRPATAEALPA